MTDRPPNRGLLFTPKRPNHIPYQRSEEVSIIIAEVEILKAQHLIPLSPKPPPTSNSWIWGNSPAQSTQPPNPPHKCAPSLHHPRLRRIGYSDRLLAPVTKTAPSMRAIGGSHYHDMSINLNAIMSDTILSQVVNRLDRIEEITYANTIGIQELQQSIAQVTQLQDRSNRPHQPTSTA